MLVAGAFALATMLALTAWEEVRRELVLWTWHYFKSHALEENKPASLEQQPWVTTTIKNGGE
jgi:hypothetical protein